MFKCSKCTDTLMDERNHYGEERDAPMYIHPLIGEFYACPLIFLSNDIMDFLDRYDYLTKFEHTAPTYDECNPRLWASIKQYDMFKYEVDEYLTKKKNSTNNSDESMSKMNALFNK